MTKSTMFKKAHAIAKTLEGNYSVRFSMALKMVWSEVKSGKVENMSEVLVEKSEYELYVEKQQQEASKRAVEKQNKEEENKKGAIEMKYSEYKNSYANCATVKDSYNKKTKTILVYVNGKNTTGICKHCGTYCYGDCQAV